MNRLLYQYNLDLTTWIYLASLLVLTIYFKFSSLLRVRNLDLICVVALTPGLWLLREPGAEQVGQIWIFVWGLVVALRLLLDPILVRRPLLEPNLNTGGLLFLGLALMIFLIGHITLRDPQSGWPQPASPTRGALVETDRAARPELPVLFASHQVDDVETGEQREPTGSTATATLPPLVAPTPWQHAPFFDWLDQGAQVVAGGARFTTVDGTVLGPAAILRKILAVVALLALVGGMVTIGYRHFGNAQTGISVTVLFLTLPYTAMQVGRCEYNLPAALLVWAVCAYRWPLISGTLIGLAGGMIYYPLFLVPLFSSFYWQRGLLRFWLGCGFATAGLWLLVGFGVGWSVLGTHLWQTFQMGVGEPPSGHGQLWGALLDPAFRLPIQVAFLVMCGSFILWPVRKNLGNLMSCTAAVLVASQFWHLWEPSASVAWCLPLFLLTVFRPNLEDRVALFVLGQGWRLRPAVPHQLAA